MRARALWVVVTLGFLPACHSGGSGGGAGDAAAGTGGTAAGGNNGGLGGSAGNRQTGAGGGAGGGGPLASAEQACRQAIEAQCHRLEVCQGTFFEDCVRFANPCPDYYFNADSLRTVAGVAACVPELAARPCTDLFIGLVPACFVNGTRANGAGCAYPSQCQSGSCGVGQACETCRAGGVPVGESCLGGACGSGSFCHPVTRVCTAGSTVVHAGQGQPCDLAATPVVGCTGDLICVSTQTGGSAGTCMPAPGAGQPCAAGGISGMICAPGTACTSSSGGTCMPIGACGGGAPCDATTFCQATDGGLGCVPRAAAGQPCGTPAAQGQPFCVVGAICLSFSDADAGTVTRRCIVPGVKGQACDDARPCAAVLNCVSGTCQPLGSTSCPADPPAVDAGAG